MTRASTKHVNTKRLKAERAKLVTQLEAMTNEPEMISLPCPDCKGAGTVLGLDCAYCDGKARFDVQLGVYSEFIMEYMDGARRHEALDVSHEEEQAANAEAFEALEVFVPVKGGLLREVLSGEVGPYTHEFLAALGLLEEEPEEAQP